MYKADKLDALAGLRSKLTKATGGAGGCPKFSCAALSDHAESLKGWGVQVCRQCVCVSV